MPKITERKIETEKATKAFSSQLNSLNVIAEHEKTKTLPKKKKSALVTFNLPGDDLENYKSWFGSKGISLSMGIRMCLDYVYYQDEKKLVITKSGIRENDLSKLL